MSTLQDDLRNIVAFHDTGSPSENDDGYQDTFDFLNVWVNRLTECDDPDNDYLDRLAAEFVTHRRRFLQKIDESSRNKIQEFVSAVMAQMLRRCSTRVDIALEDTIETVLWNSKE